MGKSWELTEDQKKEIQEQQAEIGAQYDPETGRKKGETKTVILIKVQFYYFRHSVMKQGKGPDSRQIILE